MVSSKLSKDMEIMSLRALLAEAVHDIGRLVNCKNPVDCGDIITEKSFEIPFVYPLFSADFAGTDSALRRSDAAAYRATQISL